MRKEVVNQVKVNKKAPASHDDESAEAWDEESCRIHGRKYSTVILYKSISQKLSPFRISGHFILNKVNFKRTNYVAIFRNVTASRIYVQNICVYETASMPIPISCIYN